MSYYEYPDCDLQIAQLADRHERLLSALEVIGDMDTWAYDTVARNAREMQQIARVALQADKEIAEFTSDPGALDKAPGIKPLAHE